MSAHSSMKWDFTEEVTPALTDELVKCLLENKRYGGKDQFAICYYVNTMMDILVENLAYYLDGKDFSEDRLEKLIREAPDKAKMRAITFDVVSKLGFTPNFSKEVR